MDAIWVNNMGLFANTYLKRFNIVADHINFASDLHFYSYMPVLNE